MAAGASSTPVRTKPSKWREIVLSCRKCGKKNGGGFGPGGKQKLSKALRKHMKAGKGRAACVGFAETGCLGVCPKNAVTVALGSAPERFLVVPAGAELDGVMDALGLNAEAVKRR